MSIERAIAQLSQELSIIFLSSDGMTDVQICKVIAQNNYDVEVNVDGRTIARSLCVEREFVDIHMRFLLKAGYTIKQ